jgi:hypothetical protein
MASGRFQDWPQMDVVVADAVSAVGGHAKVRVQPVEGLLGGPLGRRVVVVVVDPVAWVTASR